MFQTEIRLRPCTIFHQNPFANSLRSWMNSSRYQHDGPVLILRTYGPVRSSILIFNRSFPFTPFMRWLTGLTLTLLYSPLFYPLPVFNVNFCPSLLSSFWKYHHILLSPLSFRPDLNPHPAWLTVLRKISLLKNSCSFNLSPISPSFFSFFF